MKNEDRGYMLMGFRVIGDIGVTIALPVVFFSWLGKTLDERWGTRPYLLIGGFFLAALLSSVIIYRKAKKYGEEYQRLADPPEKHDDAVKS